MLNLFHGGRLAAMPPKLVNEEGDLLVLRPLAFLAEEDCARSRGPSRRRGQTSSSFEGMIGKKTPPERRPNQRLPSTSASSPISTSR